MTDITIYHNPACGTSRNTLALIRNSGTEPTVILYLETPPSRDELKKLITDMDISVRALLRKNTDPYEQLGLAEDRFALLREVLPDCLPERQLKKTGSAGPHSHK